MIDPIAFTLGPFTVRWYGILMALGFLIGYFIAVRIGKERGIGEDIIATYTAYLIVFILIGARLFHVFVYHPAYYLADPVKILMIWKGGLASHGAILGSIVATWIVTRKYKLKFYDLMDIMGIMGGFGAAFVRIGNFINGEIVGRVTDVPWAMDFGDGKLRHPSQLYESAKNLMIFGILYSARNVKKFPPGFMSWGFVFLFSIFRFIVEFWKEYQVLDPATSPLTMGQWASIPFFIVSSF